ncbi:MAG: 30S ribosomal protein S6 [Bacteroidota bacterium]|nr:30S ribosomal protein S6 [Bacteroidota bacterium]
MKTNAYESAVIINAALEDQQIEAEIARIKETILVNGGEITEMENWGRKRLAYIINKSKVGYYVIFKFNAPSNIVAKLERFYTLNEYILRFLTIKLGPEALEYFEKVKITEANKVAEAEAQAIADAEQAAVVKDESVPTIADEKEKVQGIE